MSGVLDLPFVLNQTSILSSFNVLESFPESTSILKNQQSFPFMFQLSQVLKNVSWLSTKISEPPSQRFQKSNKVLWFHVFYTRIGKDHEIRKAFGQQGILIIMIGTILQSCIALELFFCNCIKMLSIRLLDSSKIKTEEHF